MTGHSDDGVGIRERDLPRKFVLKVLGDCETRGLWGMKHTREPVERMVRYAKDRGLSLPIVQMMVTREGVFVLPLDFKPRTPNRSDSDVNITIPRTEIAIEKDAAKQCFRIKARFRIVKRKKAGEAVCKGCGRERDAAATAATAADDDRLATDLRLMEKYKGIEWHKSGVAFYPVDRISYGVQDLVYTRVFSMIEVFEARSQPRRPPFVCHSFVCESHATAKLLTHALDAAFQAYGRTLKRTK